jgi:hypothetical protein
MRQAFDVEPVVSPRPFRADRRRVGAGSNGALLQNDLFLVQVLDDRTIVLFPDFSAPWQGTRETSLLAENGLLLFGVCDTEVVARPVQPTRKVARIEPMGFCGDRPATFFREPGCFPMEHASGGCHVVHRSSGSRSSPGHVDRISHDLRSQCHWRACRRAGGSSMEEATRDIRVPQRRPGAYMRRPADAAQVTAQDTRRTRERDHHGDRVRAVRGAAQRERRAGFARRGNNREPQRFGLALAQSGTRCKSARDRGRDATVACALSCSMEDDFVCGRATSVIDARRL